MDKEILTHPLVEKMHPNPDEHVDYIEVLGYVGPSKKEGNVRIYLDPTFHRYYEVAREHVVHAKTGPSPVPWTIIVKADAPIEYNEIAKQAGPAAALHGAITSAYLPRAAGGSFPGVARLSLAPSCDGNCRYLYTWFLLAHELAHTVGPDTQPIPFPHHIGAQLGEAVPMAANMPAMAGAAAQYGHGYIPHISWACEMHTPDCPWPTMGDCRVRTPEFFTPVIQPVYQVAGAAAAAGAPIGVQAQAPQPYALHMANMPPCRYNSMVPPPHSAVWGGYCPQVSMHPCTVNCPR